MSTRSPSSRPSSASSATRADVPEPHGRAVHLAVGEHGDVALVRPVGRRPPGRRRGSCRRCPTAARRSGWRDDLGAVERALDLRGRRRSAPSSAPGAPQGRTRSPAPRRRSRRRRPRRPRTPPRAVTDARDHERRARCGTRPTRPGRRRSGRAATTRPDGTSTVDARSHRRGAAATRPDSTAQAPSAIVPWPQAVE